MKSTNGISDGPAKRRGQARLDVEAIRGGVRKLDPEIIENDEMFGAACALLACANGVINQQTIARSFGLNRSLVSKWFYYWKKNKIIVGRKLHPGDWWDKKAGGIAFWLDVTCGIGWIERV